MRGRSRRHRLRPQRGRHLRLQRQRRAARRERLRHLWPHHRNNVREKVRLPRLRRGAAAGQRAPSARLKPVWHPRRHASGPRVHPIRQRHRLVRRVVAGYSGCRIELRDRGSDVLRLLRHVLLLVRVLGLLRHVRILRRRLLMVRLGLLHVLRRHPTKARAVLRRAARWLVELLECRRGPGYATRLESGLQTYSRLRCADGQVREHVLHRKPGNFQGEGLQKLLIKRALPTHVATSAAGNTASSTQYRFQHPCSCNFIWDLTVRTNPTLQTPQQKIDTPRVKLYLRDK